MSLTGQKRTAVDAQLVDNDRDYLQFTPLGGGCEVGRSCHILRFKGKTIMLDCLAAGTLVTLEGGTSVAIESVRAGDRVLALSKARDGLVGRTVAAVLPKGNAACIELLFNDGRTLLCTPDHRILTAAGTWCRAGELVAGTSEVRVGIEYPVIGALPASFRLAVDSLTLDQRSAPLFCRLIGYLLADGTLTLQTGRVASYKAKVFVGHELDRDAVLRDIRAITGVDATLDDAQDHITAVVFPLALWKAALAWTAPGDRLEQLTSLPLYVLASDCPIALVCEFLGGLFGGDGHTLSYAHKQGIFGGLAFSWIKSGRECSVEEQQRAGLTADAPTPLPLAQAALFEQQLVQLLKRAGVEDATVTAPRGRVGSSISEESSERVKKAKGEGLQLPASVREAEDFDAEQSYEIKLNIGSQSVLAFANRIGFRYCCHKQVRLTAAAAYVRSGEYIAQQREVLRKRVRELPVGILKGLKQAKDELRETALLHLDNEVWLPLQQSKLNSVAPRGKGATRLTGPQAMQQWGIAAFFGEERKGERYVHTKTLTHARRVERQRRAAGQCFNCQSPTENDTCSDECQVGWQRRLDEAADYSQRAVSQGSHGTVHYTPPRGVTELPLFKVKLLMKRDVGLRSVYDLSVPATEEKDSELDSFQANGVVVHNCGLHPAYSGIASLPYFDEINPADIDLVLITHFHLDHAAALPYFLQRTNFTGRTFMTHPTKSIYKLILQDYVKVSSISVEETLYTERELIASMDKIECVNYHQVMTVDGVRFWCYNAGHVLGAAMFMIEIGGVRILYTGDYSRTEDRHLMAAELPLPSLYPHVLIVEATYGTQVLRPVEEREQRFCALVQDIVEERAGSCLIPVFALGRAQELLLILDEYWAAHPTLHTIPIYYASFLAKRCMMVYQTYLNMMNNHIQQQATTHNPFAFRHVFNLKDLSTFDDSLPCVILASPGMLQNGVSRELLELWCSEPKNGVIIAGYAVDGTLAKHVLSEPTHITSASGVRLPFRMSVHYVSFSAHADYRETSEFIDILRPANCILVHGDVNEGVGKLKAALLDKYTTAMNVQGPHNCQTVEIEFKQSKVVKVVGRLAEQLKAANAAADGAAGADGRVVSGVVVRKDFTYQLMSVEELSQFTPISCTAIRQQLLVPFQLTFECFITFVRQLYEPTEEDEDEDGTAEQSAAAAAADAGVKGEGEGEGGAEGTGRRLAIHRSVIGLWRKGVVELQWDSSPIDDMIADSVVSLITNAQASPGGARLVGVSHQHGHQHKGEASKAEEQKEQNGGESKVEQEESQEVKPVVVKRESEESGSVKQEPVSMKAEAMEEESKMPPVDTTDKPLAIHTADDGSIVVTPAPHTQSLFDTLCHQYGNVTVDEQRYTVRVRGHNVAVDRTSYAVSGDDSLLVRRVQSSVVRWQLTSGPISERWVRQEVGWRIEELETQLKREQDDKQVLQ